MISSERIIVSNGSHSSLEEEKDERLSTSSGEGSSKSAVSRGSSSASSSSSSKKESKKIKASKKDSRDPQRFLGEGVIFKAKLIGVRDVAQPRGEKMAQDVLQELKMQKKTSGDHKQKIVINISLEGLQIKDEKTKLILYLHPVHKISFISQDALDNRAFGYIYGSPDNKHTFFAIKTEKAAQQIVMCMRDLFQIAYELKKDEIVLFRQQQQQQQQEQQLANDLDSSSQSLPSSTSDGRLSDSSFSSSSSSSPSPSSSAENGESSSKSEPACVLVDFASEEPRSASNCENNTRVATADMLGPIEDGVPNNDPFFSDPWGYLSSMSNDTPVTIVQSDSFGLDGHAAASFNMGFGWSNSLSAQSFAPSDPFNTSFVNVPNVPFSTFSSTPVNPESVDTAAGDPNVDVATVDDRYAALAEISNVLPNTSTCGNGNLSVSNTSYFATEISSNNDISVMNTAFTSLKLSNELEVMTGPFEDQFVVAESPSPTSHSPQTQVTPVTSVFSDLDPLGKDRPYVDKKDFFHDLKNPPKKVLKDLIAENGFGYSGSLDFGLVVPQTPSPSPSQVSSDDDLSTPLPPPSNAPPPLPPPFHRRTSTVSPTSSLEDAVMASATPSPTSDVLLLPPPPPPRPHASSLPPPVPHRQMSCGDGGERGSLFLLSSPPIPIPSRRSRMSVTSTSSSSSCSSSSSSSVSVHPNANQLVSTTTTFNAPVSQDPNNNSGHWVPMMTTMDQMTSQPNNRETSQNILNANSRNILALNMLTSPTSLPPPSSGPRRNCALQNRSLQMKLGVSEMGDNKCDIFRKEKDPFADDDFFAALQSDNKTSFNRANNHVWNASFNDNQ